MKRVWLKRTLIIAGAAITCLIAVVLIRTLSLTSAQIPPGAGTPLKLNESLVVTHLQRALQIRTISYQGTTQASDQPFQEFHAFLQEAFPRVHATMKREVVSGSSLLYTWPGEDAGRKPMLLLAHMDVVPADPAGAWKHPPFSGALADGFIWGRGALDDKGSLLGILEAAEALLTEGFRTPRTIYLAFGHDEETGGQNGAVKIAAILKSRGVKAEVCLDEGMSVLEGVVPGVARPVGMIGIAEKGYLTLELSVEGEAGHSSQPPKETVLGILSSAVARLASHPLPAGLHGPARETLTSLAPDMPFGLRLALANLWLFEPLVVHYLEGNRTTAAAMRTTIAPTMMGGGTKENILPSRAWAIVNCRLMPGDTIENVIGYIKRTIADDRVQVRPVPHANNASPVSSVSSPGFIILSRTVRQAFPGVPVAPALVLGATDSRHYADVTEATYRFSPMQMSKQDIGTVHGVDERIGRENYLRCIRFYGQFIRNAASE
jgi:carboxypeptidase PM20D1